MLLKQVTKIKVMSKDHHYVESFSFWSTRLNGEECEIFRTDLGEQQDGIETTFELEEGEKVVGIYGIMNNALVLQGLGFIVWKP